MPKVRIVPAVFLLVLMTCIIGASIIAAAQDLTPDIYSKLPYRHIGPEGNRCTAIIGEPGNPHLIYAGAASGGVWKSTDAGLNWEPIFDDQDGKLSWA